ncbi:MAG: taurine catabolism dioxygenase TauD [Rhodospirillaceae bacterium]|nr:taurine catabolism dioxygenase TauD [Rhodospirillaceae bacterium]|tara:strand:+ start:2841 stop:3728 length:888 start_codon:yes stop_codon:yes gene_type:complete
MKVTPVSEIVGAEITDVNLADPISEDAKSALRKALLDHLVLVIRDQTLTPEQQVTFSEIWGELETPSNIEYTTEETHKVMILSNEIRPDGTAVGVVDGGDFWHSDSSHIEIPSAITILQSVRNPERGGDTEFCNMYAAYEGLSDDIKEKIDGLYGIHHVSKVGNKRVTISPDRPGAKDFYKAQAKARPKVIQPLVLEHPETGQKALYCSPRFTVGIHGMSEEESDPILDAIFAPITDRKRPNHYRHKYRENDLVMWDNRCICHRAVGGYGLPDIRRMHRTVVGGDRPYADQHIAA